MLLMSEACVNATLSLGLIKIVGEAKETFCSLMRKLLHLACPSCKIAVRMYDFTVRGKGLTRYNGILFVGCCYFFFKVQYKLKVI